MSHRARPKPCTIHLVLGAPSPTEVDGTPFEPACARRHHRSGDFCTRASSSPPHGPTPSRPRAPPAPDTFDRRAPEQARVSCREGRHSHGLRAAEPKLVDLHHRGDAAKSVSRHLPEGRWRWSFVDRSRFWAPPPDASPPRTVVWRTDGPMCVRGRNECVPRCASENTERCSSPTLDASAVGDRLTHTRKSKTPS